MDAFVYADNDDWWIKFYVIAEVVDEAGPFEDETEAVMAAERSVFDGGTVRMQARGTLFSEVAYDVRAA